MGGDGSIIYAVLVRLDRIYTRAGDAGQTSLGDGERVSKNDARIWAYGTVDETGAAIGAAVAGGLPDEIADLLHRVQNDLFDVGADASARATSPRSRRPATGTPRRSSRSRASSSREGRRPRPRSTWRARPAAGPSGARSPWASSTR